MKRRIKMKTFKIITREIITYKVVVEAKDFDDACANWHNKDTKERPIEYKEIGDREWETEEVTEVKEEI
jgi:hypothetical protein